MKWYDRVVRTVIQIVVAVPFTVFVQQFVLNLPEQYVAIVWAAFTIVVGALQNYAEDRGWITPVLKR